MDSPKYLDPDPDPGTRVLRGLRPGTGYFILANTRPTLIKPKTAFRLRSEGITSGWASMYLVFTLAIQKWYTGNVTNCDC